MEGSKFEIEVIERLKAIETKLELQDYKGVQEKVNNSLNLAKNNDVRISKLEDTQKWIIRLVLGAVILGILAFVYNM